MVYWKPAQVCQLLRDEELVWSLLDAVRTSEGIRRSDKWTISALDRHVRSALDAVGQDIDGHPRRELLLALIRDEQNLDDEQIGICLELIYSHMINRFKGDLMEILAWRPLVAKLRLLQNAGRLPAKARWIWGSDIQEPLEKGRGWAKGADAILVASGAEHNSWIRQAIAGNEVKPASRSWVIYGIGEIKSYYISNRVAAIQLSSHLSRLRHGLRISGKVLEGSRLQLCGEDGEGGLRTLPIAHGGLLQPLRFLVTPMGSKGTPFPEVSAGILRGNIEFERIRIMSAAYCMTEWFCGQLGRRVFVESSSGEEEAAEAGFNRIKEALYHIQLRDYQGLKEFTADPARWKRRARRLDRIAGRLYNAYGWGLAEAVQHREMMWSSAGNC